MKRILAPLLFVVGAVMAFFVLVPSQSTITFQELMRDRNPAVAAIQLRLDAQRDSFRLLNGARGRLVALEIARRLPRSSQRFAVSADPEIPAAMRASFEQVIRAELAPVIDSLQHPIRVHFANDPQGEGRPRRIAVLPRDVTEPCTIVLLVAADGSERFRALTNEQVVSTCGYYATFGMPGSGVYAWLLDTRGRYAAGFSLPPRKEQNPRQRLNSTSAVLEPAQTACVAGDDVACEMAWDGPEWQARLNTGDAVYLEETRGTVAVHSASARFLPGRNLSDLRRAMTDARFRELWRSGKYPAAAYLEIEGRSIGHFVRERLLLEVEPYRPGPLRAELPFMLGIAVAAAVAFAGITLTKRVRS